MLNIKSSVAVLTTSLILSACGSDNHQSKENNSTSPTIFTTEFKSDLTLQKDSDPVINIVARASNQDDNINAYSVTHHFDRGSSSIILSYNFDKSDISKTLHINYDPILKEILSISLSSKWTQKVGPTQYACSDFFYDACKNIQINFDNKTGYSEITFNNTKLSTPKLTIAGSSNAEKSFITLNGKLIGSLSNSPQTFEDIKKTSVSNLSINSQPISPMGIIYDPESQSITFNTHTDNDINQGLKSDLFTTLTTYNNGSNSSVHTKAYPNSSSPMMGCLTLENITIPIKNPLSIKVEETVDKINFAFNQTTYEQTPKPSSDCPTAHINLHGTIQLNKPLTEYTITSDDKNSYISPFNQPALYFDVINNNKQEFGNETIQVMLKNNSIEKINFKEIRLGVDLSTGLLRRFESNFSCDKTQPCQGISYDKDKTKVTFNNTALIYKDEKDPTYTRVFHINGVFDFAGR